MNKNDFLNMIEDNVPVNHRMIGQIYELLDIFPYFQSAHLLLLKSLHDIADVKFENQLRNSAIHIGNREVLYWKLNHPSSIETDTILPIKTIEPKEEIVADTEQTVIESAKNSQLMINEIERNSDESELSHTLEIPGQDSGHSVLIASEPDITEPAEIIVLMEEVSSPAEEKVIFMDPGILISEHSDLLELDLEANHNIQISSIEEDRREENARKQLQSELIDKFITANPRIEPIRDKSTISNEDISKPFLEESGGLVTETLAKIYVTQGYYSKAIDIYEKLSLKIPEKSSYFASQIEKVKEYIKK